MDSYSGDIKKANVLVASYSRPAPGSGKSSPSPSPLSSADAEALAFRLQTQIDTTDLAAYLSTSPSLLSQVVNQNVGSYVTDDYVRNLFLATAAIKFINTLPTPTPTPTPTPRPGTKNISLPPILSLLQPVASDCPGVNAITSGLKCLNDVSSIEVAFANAHIQREACYWSKHVIMPTYSDIELWAQRRGPYEETGAAILGRSAGSTPPPTQALITVNLGDFPGSLNSIDPGSVYINGLFTGGSYEPTSLQAVDAMNAINADMTVLTMPSGC
ncbi:MAG TPA: hypothetical protein VMT95_05440 [Candidatus Binatia bacterium]|nr:hypothetical protein [Candidatus Binatia bacterium]